MYVMTASPPLLWLACGRSYLLACRNDTVSWVVSWSKVGKAAYCTTAPTGKATAAAAYMVVSLRVITESLRSKLASTYPPVPAQNLQLGDELAERFRERMKWWVRFFIFGVSTALPPSK